MPTPACEDIDTIARRIAELRKAEIDSLNCLCRRPDDGGPVDSSKCPVHGATTAPVAWGETYTITISAAFGGWFIPARVVP